MNIFTELVSHIKRRIELEKQIDKLVYAWLLDHYTLWTNDLPTEDQIGTLYIGPNNAYPESSSYYNDFCKRSWGWDWCFTHDYDKIKINFNTVKNQWLDIDEDNEKVVTFEELLKYNG